jgi:hypothetical protein
VICGSIDLSLGRKMRVGQLSTIAGAIALPSISKSDWVAKTTDAFFFRSVLDLALQELGSDDVGQAYVTASRIEGWLYEGRSQSGVNPWK